GAIAEHPMAVRSVCPWDQEGDYDWRRIKRLKRTNEELLAEVNRYPRLIAG
ncbi:unnamed protein product, partial [marine sediment metagenome]